MTTNEGRNWAAAEDVVGALLEYSDVFDQFTGIFVAIQQPGEDVEYLATAGAYLANDYANFADSTAKKAGRTACLPWGLWLSNRRSITQPMQKYLTF